MDINFSIQVIRILISEIHKLFDEFRETSVTSDYVQYNRFSKLLHILAPVITAVVFYQYLKRLVIFNACQYEKAVRKRCGYLKHLSKQLRLLAKRYGNFYFCYMPMNHGTTLPPSYSLFMAIKEVLTNANRPITRVMRTNLLLDLVHGDFVDTRNNKRNKELGDNDLFNLVPGEVDPLSEYNLDIMKCSRELIIQGVKDFDVMSAVYRVMETVIEDID